MAYGSYKDLVKRTGLASMIYKVFDKESTGSGIQMNNLLMNFINQLLRNLKDAKSILLLKTVFGELILLICN